MLQNVVYPFAVGETEISSTHSRAYEYGGYLNLPNYTNAFHESDLSR